MSCFAFTLSLVRGHDVRESYFRAPLGSIYIVYALYQILVGDKVVYDKQKMNREEQQENNKEKDLENIIIKF
jgi:hypothetical protein